MENNYFIESGSCTFGVKYGEYQGKIWRTSLIPYTSSDSIPC